MAAAAPPPLLPPIASPLLAAHALPGRPDVAFLPNAVSPAVEASLVAALGFQKRGGGGDGDGGGGDYAFDPASPPPGWTQAVGRAVRAFGGAVDARGALLPAPLPGWLAGLVDRLAPAANHVLANAYAPGAGVDAHTDGPVYAPCAVIVSLAGWAVLRFYEQERGGGGSGRKLSFSVALPPRSAVAFWGGAYAHCLHGIDEATADAVDGSVINSAEAGLLPRDGRGGEGHAAAAASSSAPAASIPRSALRVSLTVRRVLRVRKGLALRLGAR